MDCSYVDASLYGQCQGILQSGGKNSTAPRMDVSLFREDEPLTLKNYGSSIDKPSGSSNYKYDELFDEMVSMPKQMPKQIFEWEESNSPLPPKRMPPEDTIPTNEIPVLNVTDSELVQLITPDLFFGNLDAEIQNVLKLKEERLKERTLSCSSDLLNMSFGSTDLAAFGLGDFGDELSEVIDSDQNKTEEKQQTANGCDEANDVIPRRISPIKRAVGIGRKRIDFEARKYIVDEASDHSDDEVDIETVPGEDGAPVIEAGNIEDLLIQFEATEASLDYANSPPKLENQTVKVTHINSPPKMESMAENIMQINHANPPPKVETKVRKVTNGKHANLSPKEEIQTEQLPSLNPANPPKAKSKTEKLKDLKIPGGPKPQKQESKAEKRKLGQISSNDIKRLRKLEEKPTKNADKGISENCTPTQSTTLQVSKVATKPILSPNALEKPSPLEKPSQLAKQNNKQIIKALPQELIDRIKKDSEKRKPITVIDPIPNIKKRGGARAQQEATNKLKTKETSSQETVISDHTYCMTDNPSLNSKKAVNKIQSIATPQNQNPTHSMKDSDATLSENDNQTVISLQPTVKDADGTLMVSLLKTNTIHKVVSSKENQKRLNLEEYKKRRNVPITPKDNLQVRSSSNSPPTNLSNKPENVASYQEKMRKMAEALLHTAPKSEQKKSPIELKSEQKKSPIELKSEQKKSPIELKLPKFGFKSPRDPAQKSPNQTKEPCKLPADLEHQAKLKAELERKAKLTAGVERKVLVSFGTNTDISISKDDPNPLAAFEKLQEMKPLIDHVVKTTENSLISSVIETIPKFIKNNELPNKTLAQRKIEEEHGECRSIVYRKIDRARCPTRTIETQTYISLIEPSKNKVWKRSPTTSISWGSRRNSPRPRHNSTSSHSSRSSMNSYSSRPSPYHSRSSDYSSRSSLSFSCDRSISSSPSYYNRSSNEDDHLNAVEERRIIYVGRLPKNTTKADLHRKFRPFGPITNISLYFREFRDNYGFVTFRFKQDAHTAYEHGNDNAAFPYYKISFGGRRQFCKTAYADLDHAPEVPANFDYFEYQKKIQQRLQQEEQERNENYDRLLKDTLYQLKKRNA